MTIKANARHTTFTTATLNVKSNPEMSQKDVVHDVKRMSKEADLIGWQEISPSRYFQAIKDLGPDWGHYMPHDGKLRIEDPISWKKSVWKKEDAGFIKTHHGLAKVSPNRYITWVKLKNKATGKEIVRINTHLVSGAFGEHKPTTEWRQEKWAEHMKKLDNLVNKFKKQGLDVVVGGDFNKNKSHVLGKDVKYDNSFNVGTHGKKTVFDYLMHAGKGLTKKGVRVDSHFDSDHNAVIAKYSLDGTSKSKPSQHTTKPPSHTTPPTQPPHTEPTQPKPPPTQPAPTGSGNALTQAFEAFLQAILKSLFS